MICRYIIMENLINILKELEPLYTHEKQLLC